MNIESTAYENMDLAQFAKDLGAWISKSGMAGCNNVEQGNLLAWHCIVEKRAPVEFLRTFHMVSGKLSLRADAMLGMFRERGGKVRWITFDSNLASAVWIMDGAETTISYSREDAALAGLLPAKPTSTWGKHPAEMLRARLISKAIRMIAPEVCAGVYTPEEVEDFSPKTTTLPVTPLVLKLPEAKINIATKIEPPLDQSTTELLTKILEDRGMTLLMGTTYLIAQKWITENINELSLVRLDKILAKPDAFAVAVGKHHDKADNV